MASQQKQKLVTIKFMQSKKVHCNIMLKLNDLKKVKSFKEKYIRSILKLNNQNNNNATMLSQI